MLRALLIIASLLPSLVAGGYPECTNLEDKIIYDEYSCDRVCDDCNGGGCSAGSGAQISQFNRGYGDPAAAYEGEEGIRFTPTYWHQLFLRIATGRTDFRCYERLEFKIRATVDNKPLYQKIMLSDAAAGSWVRLEDYVEGNVIDNTKWHTVSIPISKLASESFPLNSVFIINFARMMGDNAETGCHEISGYEDNPTAIPASCDTPQHFFIDNMVLKPGSTAINVLGHQVTSERSVDLRVSNGIILEDVKAAIEEQPATAFALISNQDSNFASPVAPTKVGFSRAAVRTAYVGGQGYAESEWTIHLLYPVGILSATEYTMSGVSVVSTEVDTVSITWNDEDVSPSVQINQLGFVPNRPKHAYVANWLGDAGGMPVYATEFQVINTDSNSVKYTGDLVLRSANDLQAGSDVFDADFSGFQETGNYQVYVPGVGRSYPFEISDTVYDFAAYTTSRLLYYKRNIPLVEPYVDSGPDWTFARPSIDPSLDGVFHPILETYSLHSGEKAFGERRIAPSWFDAGDYGHYMHNLYKVWPAYNLAFDLGTPQDNVLNIPESGNGIPDLLDELEFGMEFALTMQAEDGGVYWRLCSRGFDQVPPQDVSEPRIIYEKTTRATAQLAGMAAIHSRLIRPYNVARADQVLAAGMKAYEYLQTHESYPPEGTPYTNPAEFSGGGAYSASSSLGDQLWASAELFRTTGDTVYQDSYKDLISRAKIDPSGAPFGTYFWWALVMTDNPNVDVVLRENARRGIMAAADQKIERASFHPYRVPKHPFIQWSGWHGQSGSVMYAPALLQAYYLTGNETYADEAYMALDMSFGANPMSQTFVTGLGAKPVLDPLDLISRDDGVEKPIPGMPSPGFTWHLPGFREPYISVNNAFWPLETLDDNDYSKSYPVLRRYVDSFSVIPHNEGTISEAAAYASTLTMVNDGSKPPKTDGSYEWTWKSRTNVLSLIHLPASEVPLIGVEYIATMSNIAYDPSEYLNRLTEEQVCAIDAPTIPQWVGKFDEAHKEFLCEEQIANFVQWSLLTLLPPSKVPFIPCEKIQIIPHFEMRGSKMEAWRAALSQEQIECMNQDQLSTLSYSFAPSGSPTTSNAPSDPPTTSNEVPIAICQDINVVADSYCQAQANINNGSYDPDGHDLTTTQVPAGPFHVGSTSTSLTVSDGLVSDTCTATVTVTNAVPSVSSISAGVVFVDEATGTPEDNGQLVVEATDPEGQTLSYIWTIDCPNARGATIADPTSASTTLSIPAGTEPQICKVSADVCDACGACTVDIRNRRSLNRRLSGTAVQNMITIVDPAAGFVSGGGFIDSPAGAFVENASLAGNADFGFVSKYKKGQSFPSAEVEFVIDNVLSFESTSCEWLVVTDDDCAKFKGLGKMTVENSRAYDSHIFGFMLTTCDNGQGKNSVPDTFRIKIWNTDNGDTVYDNMSTASADAYDGTSINGGNIQIHQQGGNGGNGGKLLRG